MLVEIVKTVHVAKIGNMTERESNELKNALDKALHLVESTVSWAEARGFTNEQAFIDFEDALNKYSCKDHNLDFHLSIP